MTCQLCTAGYVWYYRLIGGDLEAVCAKCGEHLAIVEVDYEVA
jgi:hypothetical protein